MFILAALDSSVLPTLGAVDALTILLAARHPELWSYYAVCSTVGSVCGASVAYRLSGLGVLHRRIKGAVFDRVTAFLKRFGSLALSLAALLPPPFPTSAFVLSAGATRYPFVAFVLSFGMGRACRFALLAYLASVFGRRFVTSVWSAHTLVVAAAFGGVLLSVGLLAWLRLKEILTAYAFRFVALFGCNKPLTAPVQINRHIEFRIVALPNIPCPILLPEFLDHRLHRFRISYGGGSELRCYASRCAVHRTLAYDSRPKTLSSPSKTPGAAWS